jgi:hypothetical protein
VGEKVERREEPWQGRAKRERSEKFLGGGRVVRERRRRKR